MKDETLGLFENQKLKKSNLQDGIWKNCFQIRKSRKWEDTWPEGDQAYYARAGPREE